MKNLFQVGALAVSMGAAAAEGVWHQLPSIPDAEGFAAPFAGVSGGALIVAGGANIPKDKWAEVFTKVWYDGIWVLEQPGGQWRTGFKMSRPLGYGVSVSVEDQVMCFGGSDSSRHYATGFALKYSGQGIQETPLPDLPGPCANACGALVGRTIYIAGGIPQPTATQAMHTFWALDLDANPRRWLELPPWPGPERMLAVAGAMGDRFFLISGVSLAAGADGKPVRTYLKDAFEYSPDQGWRKLPDMPRATVAAPSPAATVGHTLRVVTGDDGANVNFAPVTEHPGFPRTTLIYDTKTKAWSSTEAPFSLATANTIVWKENYIVPNGEERPRVRSPKVWALPLSQEKPKAK